jgi:hypothetical protein
VSEELSFGGIATVAEEAGQRVVQIGRLRVTSTGISGGGWDCDWDRIESLTIEVAPGRPWSRLRRVALTVLSELMLMMPVDPSVDALLLVRGEAFEKRLRLRDPTPETTEADGEALTTFLAGLREPERRASFFRGDG